MPLVDVLDIKGGIPLKGEVVISGAKNAILPLMAASVLTDKTCVFKNVPEITDVESMIDLLRSHDVHVARGDNPKEVKVTATCPRSVPNDPTLSGKFRASTLLLGPLLARLGKARVYHPGGDEIDSKGRPVEMHVANLRSLGANVVESRDDLPPFNRYFEATAPNGLTAPRQGIVLPKVSVGATQNTIMAACVARGNTVIKEASIEPETLDLVKLLQKLGANIQVDKVNRKITVSGQRIETYGKGKTYFSDAIEHTVIPDRIVAGTYAIAAALTGGRIDLNIGAWEDQTVLELWESDFWRFLAAGVEITRINTGFRVERKRDRRGNLIPITPVSVTTKPFPGFPTDLHPLWTAFMCFCSGQCWIHETVFDNRFNYVPQLRAIGAVIEEDIFNKNKVRITGNSDLQQSLEPIEVEASDIRAGAALILAAVARQGETRITGLHHLDRGYENLVTNFKGCGSKINRCEIFIDN